MDLIETIQQRYRMEYFLMPDSRIQSVELILGDGVPESFHGKIKEYLSRMGVPMESGGLMLTLDLTPEEDYVLRGKQGQVYYFSHELPQNLHFKNYDETEAISWTIYILAGNRDWLEPYEGRKIFCYCFSARQQAIAAQITASVKWQYQYTVPDNQLEDVLSKVPQAIEGYVSCGPRASARPLKETALCHIGKTHKMPLGELEQILFEGDLLQELRDYCAYVKGSNAYLGRGEDMAEWLAYQVKALPAMAVSGFFESLRDRIDQMSQMEEGLWRNARGELRKVCVKPQDLKAAFASLDNLCRDYVKQELERDFLQAVYTKAKKRVWESMSTAIHSLQDLQLALSRFCFVDSSSLGHEEKRLTWAELTQLTGRELTVKPVSWDAHSLSDLQLHMGNICAPERWICSERLYNLAELNGGGHVTNRWVSLPDEQLVWAIWAERR